MIVIIASNHPWDVWCYVTCELGSFTLHPKLTSPSQSIDSSVRARQSSPAKSALCRRRRRDDARSLRAPQPPRNKSVPRKEEEEVEPQCQRCGRSASTPPLPRTAPRMHADAARMHLGMQCGWPRVTATGCPGAVGCTPDGRRRARAGRPPAGAQSRRIPERRDTVQQCGARGKTAVAVVGGGGGYGDLAAVAHLCQNGLGRRRRRRRRH